jgi:hypothetical protein
MKRLFAVGLLSVGLVSLTNPAWAQRTPDPEAERLFADATKEFEAGNFASACPKFLASYRLHEGTGTLLNLAACWEKQGDSWRAYNAFALARARASSAAQHDRVTLAASRMSDLEPKVSRVQLSGVTTWITSILVEGQPQIGVGPGDPAVRLDAFAVPSGRSITIMLSGPGRTLKPEMLLRPGEVKTVDVAPPPRAEGAAGAPSSSTEKLGTSSKVLPAVLLGVGIAGIVVGSVSGIVAIGKGNDYNDEASALGCRKSPRECPLTQQDVDGRLGDLRLSASSAATVSTTAFVVGGLLAATGITLLLLPSASSPTSASGSSRERSTKLVPSPAVGGGGLTLLGTF